jgi:hypothetical protein
MSGLKLHVFFRSIFLQALWACLTVSAISFAVPTDCEALIASLAGPKTNTRETFAKLKQLENETAQGSLIEFQKTASSEFIESHNKKIEEALKEVIRPWFFAKSGGIRFSDAHKLVRLIMTHPTNGPAQENIFDPNQCYGFCFGRATLIHNEALRRKVDPDFIRKIWAVGPTEKQRWQFHVATLIKARDLPTWWACDPIFEYALDVQDWILRMKQFSDDGRMMFFVTEAHRFSVYDPRPYSPVDLLGDGKTDYYNGYFKTYLEYSLKQPEPAPFQK